VALRAIRVVSMVAGSSGPFRCALAARGWTASPRCTPRWSGLNCLAAALHRLPRMPQRAREASRITLSGGFARSSTRSPRTVAALRGALRSGLRGGLLEPDPLVSITVATVGRTDALIDRAPASLLAQTHTNLEVLVVGDRVGPSLGRRSPGSGIRASITRISVSGSSPTLTQSPLAWWAARWPATRQRVGQRESWLLHSTTTTTCGQIRSRPCWRWRVSNAPEIVYGGFEQHEPDGRRVYESAQPRSALRSGHRGASVIRNTPAVCSCCSNPP